MVDQLKTERDVDDEGNPINHGAEEHELYIRDQRDRTEAHDTKAENSLNDETINDNKQKSSTKAGTGKPELGIESHTFANGMDDEMDRTHQFNIDDSRSNMISEQYKTWQLQNNMKTMQNDDNSQSRKIMFPPI